MASIWEAAGQVQLSSKVRPWTKGGAELNRRKWKVRNLQSAFYLKLGYSQLYATQSLEILKIKQSNSLNQSAWAMLTFKPVLFK